MQSIVYGKPILHNVITLRSLIANFQMYTAEQTYSGNSDEVQYEETLQAIDLIKGSMTQIDVAKASLQALIDQMKDNYDNAKNKEEKKILLQEFEKIEEETHFYDAIKEASDLHFMLGTRLTEAISNEKRLERKLGIYGRTAPQSARATSDNHAELQSSNSDNEAYRQPHFSTHSIAPPRVNVPVFSGNEEEFPEFWAIYEHLVHNNPTLSTIEKMLVLKESLQGKSDRSIRGIQLIPQNYEWMIKALHKKYGNKPANRARIVQQLNELPRANKTAQSCEIAYDNICMLLNQMFSTGQDIRASKDALWTEAILNKFPKEIVEPVLLKMREYDDITVDAILDFISSEISAKAYIQSRLRPFEHGNKEAADCTTTPSPRCAICETSGHFTWQCQSALPVSTKREIVARKRLCWKCYSPRHSSAQCSRNNCRLCGRMHHVKLCFANESADERDQLKQKTVPVSEGQQRGQRNFVTMTNKQTNDASRKMNSSTCPQQRKSHNANMHVEYDGTIAPDDVIEREQLDSGEETTEHHTNIESNVVMPKKEQIALMTAEGSIWNHDTQKFEKVIFFFDTGAQRTVIQEDLAARLNLPKLKTETCVMSGIGGKTETFQSNIVHVKIGTAYGRDLEILIRTKPILTNGFPAVKLCPIDQQFLEKRNLLVCNPNLRGEHHIPNILVGLDHYYSFVLDSGEHLLTPSGLRIANTIFGPTVYGRGLTDIADGTSTTASVSYSMTAIEETERELLSKLFELEGLGIASDESPENNSFLEYFRRYSDQVSFEDGYVTAPFPLKSTVQDLADNYSTALKRLMSLNMHLEKNTIQKDWYCKILKQYEDDDIIEQVKGDAIDSVGVYYMPHSGVWKPHKQKPLRIVFDASSKRKGQLSLNDVTHKGETLVNKIHDILIASRTCKIILVCDIEAAFTQIRLKESHRDLCRFLWLKDISKPPTQDNIIKYRFKRIPFGAKPSPSILNMCLLSFLHSKNNELAKEIGENLYVDNVLLSADTPSEALKKYSESKALLAEIGMNLREYVSNSNEVNSAIPEHDRAPGGTLKILGVTYNTESDKFHLNIKFPKNENLTKRDVVSQLNSIYDPLGLAAPLTIRLKHLMREIYDSTTEWKAPVSKELADAWDETCAKINNISLSIPRYSFGGDIASFTLWIFSDASTQALAACAFFRNEHTLKVSSLTSGKARLTPKKIKQTIPKLELLAMLIAVRLGKTIVTASKKPIEYLNILSDSEIALSWVTSKNNLPAFVENQRNRIMKAKHNVETKGTPVKFWHVPTDKNPADAGTRGTDAVHIHNLPWIVGPQWLSSAQVPSELTMKIITTTDDLDIPEETTTVTNTTSLHTSRKIPPDSNEEQSLISLARFSRLDKAIRTVARVCKIIRLWVEKVNRRLASETPIRLEKLEQFSLSWGITAEDFSMSETALLADSHKSIPLEHLRKRFPQKKVFRDEAGVIRYRSRLQNSILPNDTKNPIYVDKDSDLARLILSDIHRKNAHCGKDHTLCVARARFWIPRPSGAFKKMAKQCVTCKKWQGLPFGVPEMPSIPKDRVILTKPFEKIGCDFMGPFQVKEYNKCYICLYTCLTTRAVHLEVVEDMSAVAFLNSFKRFVSRRGTPKLVRTDCGSNFKLGQRVIETMFGSNPDHDNPNETCLMSYCAQHRIQWIFNPPEAPWMGGAWERLVGTVKRAFNKAVGRRKLTYTEFLTIITEIEAVINTRPLTACSSNVEEIPLRPVDFLQKSLKYALPPCAHEEIGDPTFDPLLIQSVTQAKQALQSSEGIAQKFWERWHSEYLTALREMQALHRKQSRHGKLREPELNEIVLVEQENLPRGRWCYGKVLELIRSSDDMVRSVKILMPNKNIWHRPLSSIYPLEIPSISRDECRKSPSDHNRPSEQEALETEPKEHRLSRKAKLRAKKVIQDAVRALNGGNEQNRISPPMARTSLCMPILMIALLISHAGASPSLLCEDQLIRVFPPNGTFEICVRTTCKLFSAMPTDFSLQLPSTSASNSITALMRYKAQGSLKEFYITCALPHICETSKDMFSKRLIGNPHCWPIRAFISVASIVYAFVSIPFLVVKSIQLRRAAPQASGQTVSTANCQASLGSSIPRDRDTKTGEQRRRSCANEKIDLKTFSPQRLSITVAVTFALVILCGQTTACQQGHMRHFAEITCNSSGKCSVEFSREVLFNEINTQMCVNILHANKSIGKISFRRLAVELHCSPRTLLFTRDTDHTVFSAKRCALMGSCVGRACSKVRPSTIIPELANASRYPGYSGCENSCGTILCGCPTILPSCSFYRIAHIPRSNFVYEVVECMEWKPIVRLGVHISLYNINVSRTLTLRPYIPQKVDDITITVISLAKPTSPILHSKFAVTNSEILAVPDGCKFPVECFTREQASKSFHLCKNRMSCDCNIRNEPIRCDCPPDSIGHIRKDVSNVLPISTPFVRITGENESITAHSTREEMTISIESKFMKESAAYVVRQVCEVSLGPLTGCYSCLEGAVLNVTCVTKIPAWVIVLCDDHSFSVECDPSNKSTQVTLDFHHAVIAQECRIECNENHTRLQLHGTLAYVPHVNESEILNSHERPWIASSSWFHDFSIPDLKPLIVTVSTHWKAALAIFGTTALLGLATYLFGPVVILYVIQVVFACVELLAKLAVTLLLAACELVKKACQK